MNVEHYIPEEWIKDYVDKLLVLAVQFTNPKMRDACALRAEHAMDLVKAWRESQELRETK